MGVPSFYRWLVEKYPLIVQDVIEEEPLEINGVKIPVDTTKPNPNKIEYDNLYLDMNGIIHPCFHPEDMPPPTTFGEVFKRMFEYIDRLFVMVRPRKLLYLAIDGVAPRAKMNQQRSRRFRAAKDAAEAAAEEERLRQEFEREGRRLPPKVDSQVFDSNVITPGTQFMSTLSFALQYYIHIKLNSDPGWKKVKVILSDANVPGEGEHKIMSYIRLQKNHPGYNPNARHCLYGLDADLIMLALATHEVHISILREVVFTPGQRDNCFVCGQKGHRAAQCDGKIKRKAGELLDKTDLAVKKPYQFVNSWILREYLDYDMQIPNSQLHRNLDRIIDDFIFICFFVGNDFLPHMPTLEIREGAIELLMSVYKKEFGSTAVYLTDRSKLNLRYVEQFIRAVGLFENNIFKRRAQMHQRESERFNRDRAQASRGHGTSQGLHSSSPQKCMRLSLDDETGTANVQTKISLEAEEIENIEELKFKLKKLQRDKNDVLGSGNGEEDKVRLDVAGWKKRYYKEKFGANTRGETEQICRDVVLKYTEGLCWVMHYYYHGVCSWKWFYPYHYAPFASDLKFLDKLNIKFDLGSPLKPFNQLLAVLPSASAHALPECFRTLMTDSNSPIVDFYPPDPEVDMNGKRFSWQGIVKLPFIEEHRLLDAVAQVEHSLTAEEIQRNSVRFDLLFVAASHRLAEIIRSLTNHTDTLSGEEQTMVWEKVDPERSEGMNGYLASTYGNSQPPSFSSPIEGMEDVLDNQVICAIYKVPDDCRGSNIACPAPGVMLPKKTLRLADMKVGGIWHEDGEKRRAPVKIIKIKRYNPQGSVSGPRLAEAAHKLVLHIINNKSEDINSAAALCPNTIILNQQLLKNDPPSLENLLQNISPEYIIVKKKKKPKKKKKKTNTSTEGEKMMLVHKLVVPTTNAKSEDISTAATLCPNTIVENDQLLKKDPPSQENLQLKLSPENIVVKETKKKKKKNKKTKTASQGENTMLVNGLVVPTTNARSDDVNAAATLCPNTIIENEQLLKKDPLSEENLQQKVSPENIAVTETKNKKRKKKTKTVSQGGNTMLVNGLVGLKTNSRSEHINTAAALCPNTIIENEQLLKKDPLCLEDLQQKVSSENIIVKTASEGENMILVNGLVGHTTVVKSEHISSAEASCQNTIIQNQQLLKKDPPSRENLQQEINPESIIVKKRRKPKRKKTMTSSEGEKILVHGLVEHTINGKSEHIKATTALCPNTIIQNEVLKKDPPFLVNLQQDISPECIIVEKTKDKKRKRKTKTSSEGEKVLVQELVEHTINAKSEGISSAPPLCPNTIIQNELVKKDSPSQENLQLQISPENIIAKETEMKKAKTSSEGDKATLVQGPVLHTDATTEHIKTAAALCPNATTEHINSAAALCPNTIIPNQPLLKENPPSHENLLQENCPECIIVEKTKNKKRKRKAKTSSEGEKVLVHELVEHTVNAKPEGISSAAPLCPNTIIPNESVNKDSPSQENLQQEISPENIIAKETEMKKAKTSSEGDKATLVQGTVLHTNATTEHINTAAALCPNATTEHVNSAAALCPNTSIPNQPLLKKDPPSQENLLQEFRPECIIVEKVHNKKKRKKKTKAEREEMRLAYKPGVHTINAKSEDINSAEAPCPNTIIQNQQLPKTEPPCQENLQQEIIPESITLEKAKNKKRKRKTKTSSEEIMLTQRLVEHTITAKSEHINSAAEDTLIQNQQLLKTDPPVQEALSQTIIPEPITVEKPKKKRSKRATISSEGENTILVEETKSQS